MEVVCVVVATTFDCNLLVLPPLVANDVPLTTIGPPSRFVNRFLMGNELVLVVNMLGLFVILGAGRDDDDEVKKLS